MIQPPTDYERNLPSFSTEQFSPKERAIKLVEALALSVLSLFAFFFQTVRNLWEESWTGKKVIHLTSEATTPDRIEPPPTPVRTEPLTFASLKEKTKTLSFQYLDHKKVLHRFAGNIFCPIETAIKIDTKYIHANRIEMPDGKTYIATQAPLDQEVGLFWKMTFQNNGFIVDITSLKDRLSGGVRAYHPINFNEPTQYDGTSVTLLKTVKINPDFSISTYKVEMNGKEKAIERLHFLGWKDFHGAELESLQLVIDHISSRLKDGLTPITHCRAGVGRTGTLITILTLIQLHEQGIFTKDNLDATVEAVILKGRECRGPEFVQAKEQLQTIIDYATVLLQ